LIPAQKSVLAEKVYLSDQSDKFVLVRVAKIVCKTLDSTFIHHEIERVDF